MTDGAGATCWREPAVSTYSGHFESARREAVIDTVLHLEGVDDIAGLTSLLRSDTSA